MNFRHGLLLGPIAAAAAAVPALARPGVGIGGFALLLGATGFALGPMIGGLRTPLYRHAKLSLLLGLCVSAGPLSVFGKVLQASTHHRPLGGATFAVVSALVIVFTVLVVARLLTWAGEQAHKVRRIAAASVLIVSVAVGGVLTALLFVRSYQADPELGHALLDAALALGLGTGASFLPIPKNWQDAAAKTGPWVWLSTLALGVALTQSSAVVSSASRAAPVLAASLSWLGG